MNLRVLIADDEEPARRRMRRLLGEFDRLKIIGEAGNGAEALKSIGELWQIKL